MSNSKVRFYDNLAELISTEITSDVNKWTSFLKMSGRLYKYSYHDHLLIFEQRPSATACAEYDFWNEKMKRYVKRGAKGIALVDNSRDFPRVRYVFDVADTGTTRYSRPVYLWKMKEEYEHPVQEHLAKKYEIDADYPSVLSTLEDVAQKLAVEYWENNKEQILDIIENSYLSEYDEDSIKVVFQRAVIISTSYELFSRCVSNVENYIGMDEFIGISDFNTRQTALALGVAVNQISAEIFHEIEVSIRDYERSQSIEGRKNHEERNQLSAVRGLPDTGHPIETMRPEPTREVRKDEENISAGEQTDTVQRVGDDRDIVSTFEGNRPDSQPETGTDDGSIVKGKSCTGQKDADASVGSVYEWTEESGGGSDSYGTYQQLTLNLFPTEENQINEIEKESNTFGSFSASQEEIDTILRLGSNKDHARLRIVSEFQKSKSDEEIADFLRKMWMGGNGFIGERGKVSAWYAEDGIHISSGSSVRYVKSAQVLSWETAVQRIGELLEEGSFATTTELVKAENFEQNQLAQSIWYMYRDFSEEAREEGYLSSLSEIKNGGFPADTELLAEKLADAGFRNVLETEFQKFNEAYEADNTLLRFRFYRPTEIYDRLCELDLPRAIYQSKLTDVPDVQLFITEDEINAALIGGSNISGGKKRIYQFFRETHTRQEQADFMKNEYGTGGRSHAVSGADDSGENHDSKGITLTKEKCDMVKLSWEAVAKRIAGMIEKERYLTPDELKEYEKKESETDIDDSEKNEGNDSTEIVKEVQMDESLEDTQPEIEAGNYHITDMHLGEGRPKEKFRANMNAIHTLQQIESEDRGATPEEQTVLSGYVGWGGLSDAFDSNKVSWQKEYDELRSTLTEKEYLSARASTLNAHFTSPSVIKAVYDTLYRMGYRNGNILEPACGVGNYFGMLPEEMRRSNLYGVELDSISGRIAQLLYPKADITIAGFETTDRRDFYDIAVGNVPFGNYKVNDKPYNKLGFSIHNYFFAKTLDQVRPGGIIAFITTRYTLDQKSPEVRKYLAQRAELLGAIRLPNNAFKANAGAEVVSDIIFLQKREHVIDSEPEWVHLGMTEDGFAINNYFVEHPKMILGTLAMKSSQYGEECTVLPTESMDLLELLKAATRNIEGRYVPAVTGIEAEALSEKENEGTFRKVAVVVPATPDIKNFSYAVVDGEVYFRENSVMNHVDLNDTAKGRVMGMVTLRQAVQELMGYQLEDYPEEMIVESQHELERIYDDFVSQYSLINSRANALAFSSDSSYYLLCSLENVDENGQLNSKADMFYKRTIRPERKVSHVDTPAEALTICIGERGKVDLAYMAELLGTDEYDTIITELKGIIFKDPLKADSIEDGWQTADEYLSGNVREKLKLAERAAENNQEYKVNVEALKKAQPKDLEASEIDVRLGATWIDKEYVEDFMMETFEPPYYLRRSIEVNYSPVTAEWRINGKSVVNQHDVAAYVTYGTQRANAYRILEDTLNLRDVRIYDTVEEPDGKQKRVLNKNETTLAQQKQQAIKNAFQEWAWKHPYRRESLVKQYNEMFNSTRPREYDGSHIRFVGMNPEIGLREHQKNAIAHILYGGNTLLAHEVGAGKTFEMAAAAMESKRLGLCQKSLFVVPNHLTLQWASEFLRLYPNAKLLVASKKDFETANRKKFCARIATGDYDAVIIGHSQFERIPVSVERQKRILMKQIDNIQDAITEVKSRNGENFTIKQMEKTRKSLQARLEKLNTMERKDDVITFEQLGVDMLFVDESQAYKNLFLYTKMRNVAGLSTSESQRASDMFMKCQYMDEITGGRGIVFASGTPVSNSMTELYTVMRYLQYETLQQKNLTHFDCWASTFGETTTAVELAPEGTGYRARTRFAKFFNLPELMNMFKEVADIKTSDQLHLPVPEAKFETIVVQPSEHQKAMVEELSERAAAVHSGMVDPTVDNMLKITSDGRKLGLDQRLMNPLLPDDPDSKLNACVRNVLRIWEEGMAKKLTQLLFCDMSTPNADGSFSVYDDIRAKLIAAGVPEREVAFIHSADTEAKKKDLFGKVRTGQVRILLGSTQKMGAGTNVQDLLVAVHHLDVGWRPSDMTQRNGRIIRQGNQNAEVQIYQYVTEGTFDAYLYQTLENKQKFISQIMTSKSPIRSCDDVDEQALSYAEIKALCAGNPLIKEKMDLDIDVARLKVLKADHLSQQYRLEDKLLKYFPVEIEHQQSAIRGLESDLRTAEANPVLEESFAGMEILGKVYAEKEDAGVAIMAACKEVKINQDMPLGWYRGFSMTLSFDSFSKEFQIALAGKMTYRVSLGTSNLGNLTRIENVISSISGNLEKAKEKLENLQVQREAAKAELGKPFPQENELNEKSGRLAELNAALNMDNGSQEVGEVGSLGESEMHYGKSSVLGRLEKLKERISPDKGTDTGKEVR